MKAFLQRHRSPVWTTTILSVIGLGTFILIVPPLLVCGRRVRPIAERNACINNLRQIDGAKEQWACEHKKEPGDLIVISEVDEYVKGGHPRCPADGTYRYGKLGDAPLCSIKRHTLP
jgi:hypothetical protein